MAWECHGARPSSEGFGAGSATPRKGAGGNVSCLRALPSPARALVARGGNKGSAASGVSAAGYPTTTVVAVDSPAAVPALVAGGCAEGAETKETSVRVAVRFRPLGMQEQELGSAFFVWPDQRTVESLDRAHCFEFDHAFGEGCSQQAVYDVIGQPIVDDILEGYNGTVLTYGQTGSGKTYCMFGPSLPSRSCEATLVHEERRGFVYRVAKQIFDRIRAGKPGNNVEYVLRCSLFEVYREQLRDLLESSNSSLKVKENAHQGIFVDGLIQEVITCETDIAQLLTLGSRMRAVAATQLNQHSSRSHVIVSLTCEQRRSDGTDRLGKLHLVDLAGSEKVWKSGSSGVTLEESKKINWSLSALGNVINALSEKRPHIPYRDSKLTRILQETLGGNFKTALLATCSQLHAHYEESISTLCFAARAKNVCNHVKVNLVYSSEHLMEYVSRLKRELLLAHRQLARRGVALCSGISGVVPTLTQKSDSARRLQWDATMLESAIADPDVEQSVLSPALVPNCIEEEREDSLVQNSECLGHLMNILETANKGFTKVEIGTQEILRHISSSSSSCPIDETVLVLKQKILHQQHKLWNLRLQFAETSRDVAKRDREEELLRDYCDMLRARLDDARREFEAFSEADANEAQNLIPGCLSSDLRVRVSPHAKPAASEVVSLADAFDATVAVAALAVPAAAEPQAAPIATPRPTGAHSVASRAEVPAVAQAAPAEEATAVAALAPHETRVKGSASARGLSSEEGGVSGQALLRKLRHTLDETQVDFSRDEDAWFSQLSRQEEDFLQWHRTEQKRIEIAERSRADSVQEANRLQCLLQRRRTALQATRDRAQLRRASCRIAENRLEALRRLVVCISEADDTEYEREKGSEADAAKVALLQCSQSSLCDGGRISGVAAWMHEVCRKLDVACEATSLPERVL